MENKLTVSSSPHIRHTDTTSGIMLDVIIALLPATVYGIVLFGFYAALIVVTCILSAVAGEYVWNLILKKPNSVKDLSAVVTGLLLALNLPPRLPLWMAAIGSAVAIIIVKQVFGGLGYNFANPAITARIVLLVSFPTAMTSFYEPFGNTVSSATPLVDATAPIKDLILGVHSGCIGETSSLMLLLGFIYLLMRRVISPIIPCCFIGTVFIMSFILGVSPVNAILSGGLMLGAIFMATDYVTSPTFPLGKVIFGVGCGIITVVIRLYGNLPEGVSYSILLMNLLVPHINNLTRRHPFGMVVTKGGK